MHAHPIRFLELLNGQFQYVVPRWQRRYRWGQSDIERLVEDLLTVAQADNAAAHYGGTLLTFPEPGAPGVVTTLRVVDGQQRLTTVSILLACIAEKLGPDGTCGEWTAQTIRTHCLTNLDNRPEKIRKLRLQHGDEEEYRRGLEGAPSGAGAVTQAWRIARRLVARTDLRLLLEGLSRLRVVTIGLESHEDPQQIFESLNATGQPLTESEKVKNWLLMGLPDVEQQDLHENYWLVLERNLGGEHTTEPTDLFLRDLLRWRTGKVHGLDRVHDGIRRWAVREGHVHDRPALCRELARLAGLYGLLTSTAGEHPDAKVRRELRHLRDMGIDIHRPLTLRLLDDASQDDGLQVTDEALATTLAGIAAWTTRLWLADRTTAGLNKAVTELAHGRGPGSGEDFADYWLGRIRRLRNSRVGVPDDGAIREGIRSRRAYGGTSTRASFAVLCALMEAEHREESPARGRLTVEHVMPQKLTDEWKHDLGDDAGEQHGRWRDRLANLTLSGDATNSGMGAGAFAAKREVYRKSPIGMTSRLSEEDKWDEAALERRAEDLARRALSRWPWHDLTSTTAEATRPSARLQWRIEDGPWQSESVASQMVLNVAAALLTRDPANARRLSGDAISSNLHLASQYPPDSKVGTRTMRAVPGHDDFVLWPYPRNSSQRCRKMGQRCNVAVEVQLEEDNRTNAFWRFFKEHTAGVPGQKDTWRGASQWTTPLNAHDDRVAIYVGNPELLWLYIRAGDGQASAERAARMRRYSWTMREQMADQELGENLEKNSEDGMSVAVQRSWSRDDEDEWPEAVQWIKEQYERLRAILADPQSEAAENVTAVA